MRSLISLLAASAVVRASSIQQPLQEAPAAQALITTKPLIDTESLQAHINSDSLLARAKALFKIAELGTKEYNHPTRVIGSEGTQLILPPPSACS